MAVKCSINNVNNGNGSVDPHILLSIKNSTIYQFILSKEYSKLQS